MNELIAMWTARAEQENNHEIALAIMQCVGELKASQEPKEQSEYDKFLDAIDNSPYAKTVGAGIDHDGLYHVIEILKTEFNPKYPYTLIVRPYDIELMGHTLERLKQIDQDVKFTIYSKGISSL